MLSSARQASGLAVTTVVCHTSGAENLTMRSSGPRGRAIVFSDILSARGRLTRR
jgi:hypothetical protein